jgi:hypothetical protein
MDMNMFLYPRAGCLADIEADVESLRMKNTETVNPSADRIDKFQPRFVIKS